MHRARTALSLAFALAAFSSCALPRLERHEFSEPHMGTTFRIVLYATSEDAANTAAAAAFARIDQLDQALSDYDEASELSRLGARSDAGEMEEPVSLSADLWDVLERAQQVSSRSRGAFDVTVGPVVALWRRARRQGEFPDEARIDAARAAVGFEKLALERKTRSARLLAAGMRLDLGGIAKGHALDQALETLRANGVDRALVDGGGDIAASAPPPGRTAWRIELAPLPGAPGAEIELANAAIATSGDAFQALDLDGRRYSHILDPRTGRALTRRIGASVVATDGALADALATAACVLGPREGVRLADGFGAAARVVAESEHGLAITTSDSFPPQRLARKPRSKPDRSP